MNEFWGKHWNSKTNTMRFSPLEYLGAIIGAAILLLLSPLILAAPVMALAFLGYLIGHLVG